MRNLTIERRKRFVASLAKMYVYLEDAEAGDIDINGVRCRKVGALANGGSLVFPIGNEAVRVYVSSKALARGMYAELYEVPAGEYDMTLTGQNIYSPASGNPFRFDNNQSEGAGQLRKRRKRFGWIYIAVCVLIGLAVGLGIPAVKRHTAREFQVGAMTLTLNGGFSDQTESYRKKGSCDAYFGSKHIGVVVERFSYDAYPALKEQTVVDYVQNIRDATGFEIQVLEWDGPDGFTYRSDADGHTYDWSVFLYKTDQALWLVQFVRDDSTGEKAQNQCLTWAKAITVKE